MRQPTGSPPGPTPDRSSLDASICAWVVEGGTICDRRLWAGSRAPGSLSGTRAAVLRLRCGPEQAGGPWGGGWPQSCGEPGDPELATGVTGAALSLRPQAAPSRLPTPSCGAPPADSDHAATPRAPPAVRRGRRRRDPEAFAPHWSRPRRLAGTA
eukprot:scaffold131660_cov63-Phaeocystis_antarctica.AAC.2